MRYLIITFLFLNSLIFSQEIQIRGKVVNQSDGSPLYLANVVIEGQTQGIPTERNGEFSLSGDFDPDTYIILSYLGFETKKLQISDLLTDGINEIGLVRKVLSSQTIFVEGSIGKVGSTPSTFSKIDRQNISESYTTQDIPEFLSYLPSTTFYSESGHGIGYNYISIRGFDQRRISVAINGIVQNDPEDHNVYWLDLPDLLESTELVQVQRGAGAGAIGYPSVGGSINIITSPFSDKQRVEFGSSFGSYNTRKYSAVFSSGLIDNKYSVYAKISNILSSGYRDKSWVNFKSYHLSAVRYDENLATQINLFGGPVADGLVYTGLPKDVIKDKNLRRANYSWWDWDADNKKFQPWSTLRRSDEIENFFQPHFEVLNEIKLTDNVKLNSALFLVIGNGFFDYDGSWAIPDPGFDYDDYFRLKQNGFDTSRIPRNALIRAMVENTQWGWIPRLSWDHNNGKLIVGAEYRNHRSVHWGSINYAENLPQGVTKDYRYYYYEGGKDILNFFVNENYNINERLNILGEVQLAYHKYQLNNEKYVETEFDINDLFLNPRIGLNYKFNPTVNAYLSFARVTREPRLKNYYDAAESSSGKKSSSGEVPQFELNLDGTYNFDNPLIKPETMNNVELGTTYSTENYSFSINGYYMLFNDEIVKKGQVDRFGQPITGNVDETIHTGVEVTGSMKFLDYFELILNGSYGKNYISSGSVFVDYESPSTGQDTVAAIDLTDNRISGFPDLTFNGILKFRYQGFTTQLFAKYVGDFYSDNYDNNLSNYLNEYPGFLDYDDNKVDAYFVANAILSYEFSLDPYFKKVKIFAQVNNIFDNLYAAYAIGKEFFPAAERNFLAGIKIGL